MVSWFSIGISVCVGYICSIQAQKRSRSPYTWFLLGLVFGWLGLMVLVFLPTKKTVEGIEPSVPEVDVPLFGWYYVDASHQVQGACSLADLERELMTRKDPGNVWIWHETCTEWQKAQQCDVIVGSILKRKE